MIMLMSTVCQLYVLQLYVNCMSTVCSCYSLERQFCSQRPGSGIHGQYLQGRFFLADEDHYLSLGGKIPEKWNASETIRFKKYSTASDAWIYDWAV